MASRKPKRVAQCETPMNPVNQPMTRARTALLKPTTVSDYSSMPTLYSAPLPGVENCNVANTSGKENSKEVDATRVVSPLTVTVTKTPRDYSIEGKSVTVTISATLLLQSEVHHNQRFLSKSTKDFQNMIRELLNAQQQSSLSTSSQAEENSSPPLQSFQYSPALYDATRPDIVLTKIPEPENMPSIGHRKAVTEWKYPLFKTQPEYHIGQAILRSANRCLTFNEVVEWLQANIRGFPTPGQIERKHFANRAINYHLSSASAYFNRLQMQGPAPSFGIWPMTDYMYEVKPGQEYRFVKPIVNDPEEAFKFMKLPAEIRRMIYKKLFVFENFAIRISTSPACSVVRKFGGRTATLIDMNERSGRQVWAGENDPRIVLNDVMAIVSTSKEVYNEALPVFYCYNSFIVDAYDLKRLNCGLGSERIKLVKNLVFFLYSGLKEGCRSLYEYSELEKLHIIVDDVKLNVTRKPNGYGQRYVGSVAGMDWLSAMRGIHDFSCSDTGQEVYKYLKDFLTKPKGYLVPIKSKKLDVKDVKDVKKK